MGIQKTPRNFRENPNVAVIVVDREKAAGYQIKGKDELLTSVGLFERVAKSAEDRKILRQTLVVKIKVEEIQSVKIGATEKRIAWKPHKLKKPESRKQGPGASLRQPKP